MTDEQYGLAHIDAAFTLDQEEIPVNVPNSNPVIVGQGGTGATDAITARANLGLGTAATKAVTDFLQAVNNLSDLVSLASARSNLGLGTAATQAIETFLQKANNLADLASTSTSRTNLGLGSSAVKSTTDFLQTMNNLSDITNAATARINLGLGSASTKSTTDFLQTINNLSDVISAAQARINLGVAAADASATVNYSGGDISIGTSNDASFADVDATNAKITFPVTVAGKWMVICNFTTNLQAVVSLSLSSTTLFQLTDGTTTSPMVQQGTVLPLNLGLTTSLATPQTLVGVFNFTAGSKTVKLQKRNVTSANVGSRQVLADSNSPFAMFAYRISD